MMARLIEASLRHRHLALLLAAVAVVAGSYRAARMPVDVFPDLTAPRVTVVTESTGMAAEEVEQLITFPIEASVSGTAGVRRVRSASAAGISVVAVEFDWDTPEAIARQRVTERLQSMSEPLPPEASAPLLAPASSVMGEIAFVAITSETHTPIELGRIADVNVRRRLLGVEGISQAVPIGGARKQYQILVDPHRLERYDLTLGELVASLERGSRNAPGGYAVEGGQEWVVRVLGRAQGPGDLERMVVASRDGAPVRVRDVADVRVGPAPLRGAASYRAEPAVVLSIVKQPEADTVTTTRRLDATLDALERELARQGVSLHRDIFRQTDFIDRAIANLARVLRDGAVLVVAVLFLFVWSVRPTLISALALPLSMITALFCLSLAGLRIDTMTLGGLAIAIGLLVDDAIVVVENSTRRLRERARLPAADRSPALATVLAATLEIRAAIVSTTLLLLLVFVPLLLLDGLEGRLLQPLAIAFLIAVGASTIVALTVTPILCAMLLPRSIERRGGARPPLMRAISRGYEPILAVSLRRPRAVAAGALVAACVGGLAFLGLGRSFLPEFNEGSVTLEMVLAPGTSLEESDALARTAERLLLEDPAVVSVGRRTGRAERDEHILGVESSEFEVGLDPQDPRDKAQIFADLRERLGAVPGAQFALDQPISHRIEHMISGQRAALSIKVFGDDLRELQRTGERVKEAIEALPDLVDVRVEPMVDVPQLLVRVDPEAAATYGFSAGEAAFAVSVALWGASPGSIYEDGTTTEVVARYSPEVLEDLDAVARARIPTPSGAVVPVAALAEVYESTGPNYVLRENVERRLVVTANVAGRDIRGAYESARRRVEERVDLPEGVRIDYAGQFERAERAGRRLLLFGGLALLGIAFVIGQTLGSARRALIVLVNLPLAVAGGVIGVYLAGGVLSVATTIGFITLFGIATRNGILLATRARDLELEGQVRGDAVAQAARERLAPILMTAITAALGLLPLALALGEPGSEIQAPMALVILTGLTTSTALNMLVVPALLARWGGRAASS
jgi:CzcA family heavy metal efflux pump